MGNCRSELSKQSNKVINSFLGAIRCRTIVYFLGMAYLPSIKL